MASFATLDDLQKMWRNLQPTERERAEALLDTVSDMLREEAYQYGKDLDNMILERESFRNVVKSVTVDVSNDFNDSRADDSICTECNGLFG